MASLTEQLATRAAGIKYQDLPEKTVQMGKQYILDHLGNSIRGWTQPNMSIMAEVLGVSSDGSRATVFNGKKGAVNSVLYAGMLNGAASHSLDFDDLHNPSIIHVACVTVPAALAVAEDEGLSGQDILAAVTAGYEAGARIGEAVNPESYFFWHTTATCGVFAAAATVGNLKKFTPAQMVECLGTAGTQAAGLWEFLVDGAMSKTLHIGKANFAGILSAKLTAKGFTAAKKILDGEKGFCLAMLPNPHWSALTADIGGYKIDENSFKPYACCKHTHPAAYAAQLLRAEHELKLADIASVDIQTNNIVKSLVDNTDPQNPYGAKFSIQYCVAAMLKFGKLGIDEFTDTTLADQEIRRVMSTFNVEVNPKLDREFKEMPERWSVELTVKDKKGNVYSKFVEYPKGDPPNPMTWSESVEKFLSLSEPVYGKKVSENLCQLVETLDKQADFRQALAACFK
jgi:2-methylcitrate dehydratase PrpD